MESAARNLFLQTFQQFQCQHNTGRKVGIIEKICIKSQALKSIIYLIQDTRAQNENVSLQLFVLMNLPEF